MVGKPREDARHFEMDVQMGGFPMKATMTTRQEQHLLEFSNGGIWSKGSPLKAVAAANPAAAAGARGIPMSEVKKHKTKDSAWVVLHGKACGPQRRTSMDNPCGGGGPPSHSP